MGGDDLLVKPVARASLCALVARTKVKVAPAPPVWGSGRLLYAEDSIPNQKIVKRMLGRGVVENNVSTDVGSTIHRNWDVGECS